MNIQGPVGLDVESRVVQEDTGEVWTAGNRSICIQDFNPTTTIFQLESRPRSQGNRCLQPTLDGSSYANPP